MSIKMLLALAALVLVTLFVTQLVLPFVQNTPFFPMFRKSQVAKEVAKAERELAETTELVQLNTQLSSAKEALDKLNQPKKEESK